MEARDFCYWLQGVMEVTETKELNEKQVQIIKDHLQEVFKKVTPTYISSQGGSSGTITLAPWSGGGSLTGSGPGSLVTC